VGSDADAVFSQLFRHLFCHVSRDYRAAVRAIARRRRSTGATATPIVPAYLLHVTAIATALADGRASCILRFNNNHTNVQILVRKHSP
jgi:hypothetical protein